MPIDIHLGVTDEIATELAVFLGFQGELVPQCAEQIKVGLGCLDLGYS